eukprot:Gb_30451 [translate_table: standard]
MAASFTSKLITILLPLLFLFCSAVRADTEHGSLEGTLVYSTFLRTQYAFDIYSLQIHPSHDLEEFLLTDGESINYNGHFVEGSGREILSKSLINTQLAGDAQHLSTVLAFISERKGTPHLFFNLYFRQDHSLPSIDVTTSLGSSRREALEKQRHVTVEFSALWGKDGEETEKTPLGLKDRPIMAGKNVVYVSTHRPSGALRESWNAIYSTDVSTGKTTRLTPQGVADYSPAVSPSGEWLVCASFGESRSQGRVLDWKTDLYISKASDGSQRKLLAENGGWPSWADDHTVFFHRRADDGWWSIYRVTLSSSTLRRITPPGIHVFTPAASLTGRWIAVATRRQNTKYRHIEIFDLDTETFTELTALISPRSNHYNPFVSSEKIGYHKCRGGGVVPALESVKSPLPKLSMLRIDGTFPSFSPDGSLIAYIPDVGEIGFLGFEGGGVYVIGSDGTGRRKIFPWAAFGTAWDWKKPGVVYTSHGAAFASRETRVDIVAIYNAHRTDTTEFSYKKLTNTGSNAFPSPSPDGKFVVFRSGRSGHYNLYIMDAEEGEGGGIRQLTDGAWTDTMCNWSPDGEWIAFASNRDDAEGWSYGIYMIRPDGTDLRKVVHGGTSGRANHPWFTWDSSKVFFTSDFGGLSAESISAPEEFQAFGDIFLANVDGSDVLRLTHNFYEDGTPAYSPVYIGPSDLATHQSHSPLSCHFGDDLFGFPMPTSNQTKMPSDI